MTRKKRGINELVNKWFYDALKYVKECSNYIWIVTGIFFLMGLFGFFFPLFFESTILRMLRELLSKTQSLGAFDLVAFIFTNNLQSAFFALIFGLFFGLFSVTMIVVNGYVLGFVANKTVINDGYVVLWKLFPHGIFELPAIMISAGLGLKLGSFVFIKHKDRKKEFKRWFFDSLKVFVFIIIPMLLIASFIEGFLIYLLS